MRVTCKVLENFVNDINERTGAGWELNHQNPGDNSRYWVGVGGNEVSPRLKAGELYEWLNGAQIGFELCGLWAGNQPGD